MSPEDVIQAHGAHANGAASAAPHGANAVPWAGRVTACEDVWFTTTPPARAWLLRDARTSPACGVLPLGKVGLLVAEGGAGKTMALVALAVAVATGAPPWLGCYEVTTPGRVLLILGEEDADETHRRLYRVRRAAGGGVPAAGSIVALPLAGLPCAMIENDDRGNPIDAPFLLWLRSEIAARGPFALVIVDPLSRFAGVDAETDNAAATRFVQALESIATETGATVLVAHHTNKTSRGNGATVSGASARGSSAIVDGVRWVAVLSAERVTYEDPDTAARLGEIVTLAIVKSNYGRKGDPVVLRRDRENGGALLRLDDADRATVEDAKDKAAPRLRERVARDAAREAKAERDESARARKDAAKAERTARQRETEDTSLRAIVGADPGIAEAKLISKMRGKLGLCSDRRARDAITRAEDEGWLEVQRGPKNAKRHSLKGAP